MSLSPLFSSHGRLRVVRVALRQFSSDQDGNKKGKSGEVGAVKLGEKKQNPVTAVVLELIHEYETIKASRSLKDEFFESKPEFLAKRATDTANLIERFGGKSVLDAPEIKDD